MAGCRWIIADGIDNRGADGGCYEMRPDKANIELWNLGVNGIRCPLGVNRLVRYVGAREQCRRHARILAIPGDRERQDQMLAHAIL